MEMDEFRCYFQLASFMLSILSWEPSARPCTNQVYVGAEKQVAGLKSIHFTHVKGEPSVPAIASLCKFSFLHSAPVTMRMFRIRAETNTLRSPGPFLSGSTALTTLDKLLKRNVCKLIWTNTETVAVWCQYVFYKSNITCRLQLVPSCSTIT